MDSQNPQPVNTKMALVVFLLNCVCVCVCVCAYEFMLGCACICASGEFVTNLDSFLVIEIQAYVELHGGQELPPPSCLLNKIINKTPWNQFLNPCMKFDYNILCK